MPAVSIILPTYNREKFLSEAFQAIQGQTFTDWELIVVDDGSTDNTKELVQQLASDFPQSVRYIYQENQGAYGARNTGLEHATGKYIAFYDSDDLWLPHHLQDCLGGLEANPDVDWVYGACRIVDHATDTVLADNSFYVDGNARPFLSLQVRASGSLRIIDDPKVIECMISHGLYNGLQNSVLRAHVFKGFRFDWEQRNEAEDQLFVVKMLTRGYTIGYFDNVHVDYKVHDANSSAVASNQNWERTARVNRLMIDGYERLFHEGKWRSNERRALRRRLGRDCFWTHGYATLWMNGRRREAKEMFRRGLQYWPWDWRCWKTYALAQLRSSSLVSPPSKPEHA